MTSPRLTDRQSEILTRILRGEPDKAISSDMRIARSTLRHHIEALFRKFNVRSRMGLAGAWFALHTGSINRVNSPSGGKPKSGV